MIRPRLSVDLAFVASVGLFACDDTGLDARSQTIASVLVRADESFIRDRAVLSRDKYALMASSRYEFYRGSFALFLHDAEDGAELSRSAFRQDGLLPLGVGDTHPENFGALWAGDGSFAIEPNDFDAADRYPWLWEVRRLAIGMVVAARSSNPSDPDALALVRASERDIARSVAVGYREALLALESGAPPERLVDGGDVPNLVDIFARASEDAATRPELDALTTLDAAGAHRRLVRGQTDPTDPHKIFGDLPRTVLDALPATLSEYRRSLLAPPPASYFRLLDAARSYGSGVASLPKIRIALLVDGPTTSPDDDVILELKELGESGAHGWGLPSVSADDPRQRILLSTRALWARPDAEWLWGTSRLLGLSVQIKGDFDAEKGVKVKRMEKSRGTPEALAGTAHALGALLARMHASGSRGHPGTLEAIAATIAKNPERFADEQADVAVRYADVVEGDFLRFQRLLATLGPRLGLPEDPADAPSPDVAALYAPPPGDTL